MKTVKHLSVLLAVLLMVSIAVVGFVVSADDPAVITVTNEEEFLRKGGPALRHRQ